MPEQRNLRLMCWGLAATAVIAAVSQLLLTFNIWAGGPTEPGPTDDLVARLAVFRGNDQEIFPIVLLGSLAALIAFLLIGLIGVAIRDRAMGSLRDTMVTILVVASVVGVVTQTLAIAVAQAATYAYCDCGFKTEELIGQDYALSLGFTAVNWLTNVAFVLVGIGAAMAGRLIYVSSTWRMLSYAIGVLFVFAILLRVVDMYVHLGNWVPQATDTVTGLTIAILVPIWAILLARGARPMTGTAAA